MRRAIQYAAALWLLLSVSSHGQEAPRKIEGRVLRADTGDPIAGATVTAFPARNGNPEYRDLGKSFKIELHYDKLPASFQMVSTQTDDDGKFVFINRSDDPHWIIAGANGYTREVHGRQVFADVGGPIVVRLTPTAGISGIVRDRDLRPSPNVPVELLHFENDEKGLKTLQPVLSTQTNDLGEYRFYHLTPDRYYLRAGTDINKSDDPLRDVLGLAFYPGVEDIRDAQMLDLHPGEEKAAIDFRLKARRLHRVRGSVLDPSGRMKGKSTVILFYVSGTLPSGGVSTEISADRTFTFPVVAEGSYVIKLGGFLVGGGPTPSTLVVADQDIDNLTIVIPPVFPISAHVQIDGGPEVSAALRNRVGLLLLVPARPGCECGFDMDDVRPSSPMDKDGRVTFENVYSGEYRLVPSSGTPFFIKEATFHGVDAVTNPLSLSPTNDPIEVVARFFSTDSGRITGGVVNGSLEPSPGVLTVLVPDDRNRPELYKTIMADAQGRFTFFNVAPGDYRVFAWESIEPYSWMDPAVTRSLESRGERVHVVERSKSHVQARVIPAAPRTP